jgi:hypothetical protein
MTQNASCPKQALDFVPSQEPDHMSIKTDLRVHEIVGKMAFDAMERIATLDFELSKMENPSAAKRAELKALESGLRRAFEFKMRPGGDYRCPRCWIDHKTKSPFKAAAGGDHHQMFRCSECGLELEVS